MPDTRSYSSNIASFMAGVEDAQARLGAYTSHIHDSFKKYKTSVEYLRSTSGSIGLEQEFKSKYDSVLQTLHNDEDGNDRIPAAERTDLYYAAIEILGEIGTNHGVLTERTMDDLEVVIECLRRQWTWNVTRNNPVPGYRYKAEPIRPLLLTICQTQTQCSTANGAQEASSKSV